MTCRALLAEELLPVLDVADWALGGGNTSKIPQIRDHLENVIVCGADVLRRHVGARHALADRREQPLVGHPAGERRDQIGTAIAAGIDPVTVGAPHPVQRHAGADRIPVSEVWIVRGGIGRAGRLGKEQTGGDDAPDREQR